MSGMLRRISLSLLGCVLSLGCLAQQPTVPPPVSPEEYKVMAAAIDAFRSAKLASHPVVADQTSTLECGSACNGLTMGGCNGLRGSDETPTERLAIVKRDLPKLERAALADFEAKNRACSKIADKIPAQSPYLLFGVDHAEKLPSGWEHADFFYFSRVGFNARQTEALVHISFMSGTDAADSGGKYFVFEKENGKWELKGSSAVWELVSR